MTVFEQPIYLKNKMIQQLFEKQVKRQPDAIAVIFRDQSITYQVLNQRANQLARYLQKIGVGQGTMVGYVSIGHQR